MKKENTMLFVILMAVALMFAGQAMAVEVGGVDVSGYAKFGYPVDSGISNTNKEISARVDVDTNYKFESKLNAQYKALKLYVGFDAGALASENYTFGAEYTVLDPVGVFIEHTDYDMKAGIADYDQTWAGVMLSF